MDATGSFGQWLKQRRKALDLTQAALARKVGCAAVTLQKIEADKLRPSRRLADYLAQSLAVPQAERSEFILFARGKQFNAVTISETSLSPSNNLIAATSPLIGRTQEIMWIRQRLLKGDARLLTLVGPGGIGKTRLAVEAAQQFPNAKFVALQPLTSPDFIVSAVASAIGFQFYSGADPGQQLLDFLRDKSWLLVLEPVMNFG